MLKFTPSLLEALMERRAEVASAWARSPDVIHLAEMHGFLPLLADMGGVAGLTPDGSVIELAWDDLVPRPVASRRWRDLSLLRAIKRYPELRAIVPARPAEARDCESCGGTGVVKINGQPIRATCVCGGLGWIPPEWRA
jgi:hypothetical protein